jgi:hypothetical protein
VYTLPDAKPYVTPKRFDGYRNNLFDAERWLRTFEKELPGIIREEVGSGFDDWKERMGDLMKEAVEFRWYLVHASLFARDLSIFMRRIEKDISVVKAYIGTEGERFKRNREWLADLKVEYDALVATIPERLEYTEFDYAGTWSSLVKLKNTYELIMYKESARDVRDYLRSVPDEVWPHLGEMMAIP